MHKFFFDQPVKKDKKTYDNIWEIANGQGDDYTTGCFLNHTGFKENYKLIATDLSKQQAFDTDQKAIQQINFTGYLDLAGNTTMFFILKEAGETILHFSQGTVRVLRIYFVLI